VTVDDISKLLQNFGYQKRGFEVMYNGHTGRRLESTIFLGPTYYQRLKHMVRFRLTDAYNRLVPPQYRPLSPFGAQPPHSLFNPPPLGIRVDHFLRANLLSAAQAHGELGRLSLPPVFITSPPPVSIQVSSDVSRRTRPPSLQNQPPPPPVLTLSPPPPNVPTPSPRSIHVPPGPTPSPIMFTPPPPRYPGGRQDPLARSRAGHAAHAPADGGTRARRRAALRGDGAGLVRLLFAYEHPHPKHLTLDLPRTGTYSWRLRFGEMERDWCASPHNCLHNPPLKKTA
jgi:hypothetical protein